MAPDDVEDRELLRALWLIAWQKVGKQSWGGGPAKEPEDPARSTVELRARWPGSAVVCLT
eukprot:7785443-Alexandrium_andersonii.AAC.1